MSSERGISDRYLSELQDIRVTVEELRNEQVLPFQRLVHRARHLYREAWRRELVRDRATRPD